MSSLFTFIPWNDLMVSLTGSTHGSLNLPLPPQMIGFTEPRRQGILILNLALPGFGPSRLQRL